MYLLLGSGAVSTSSWLLLFRDDDVRQPIVIHLAELFSQLESVCELGHEALDELPFMASTRYLLDGMFSEDIWEQVTENNITTLFKQQVRSDFNRANTMQINHWVLSKTEVYGYALIAKLSCQDNSFIRSFT